MSKKASVTEDSGAYIGTFWVTHLGARRAKRQSSTKSHTPAMKPRCGLRFHGFHRKPNPIVELEALGERPTLPH